YLEDFFRVFVSSETKANVLSFAEVEDMYEITYVPRTSFVVHLPGRDIEFVRKGKLYVADFSDHYHYQANLTKQEFIKPDEAYAIQVNVTKQVVTKAEEARAKQAYELIRNSGFVSVQEAIHLLEEGNIANMPQLVAADFHRALELYSPPVEYVRGKTTRKRVSRAVVDDNLILDRKQQVLYVDVMYIDKQRFLVSVSEPLQLTVQCQIERESQEVLGTALQGHFEVLRSRGFIPVRVHADPQSAFHSLTTAYPGVTVDIGGAGDYVAKIDRKIRSIKELYRCVKAGLPWQLPTLWVKDLVTYAVARINIQTTKAINQTVVPKVLFTGLRVDFKELSLAFSDYCEVYAGTDNTSRSRTVPCIAFYPCSNAAGSWTFYNLVSNTRIRRSQWKKMVTTSLVIDTINHLSLVNEPAPGTVLDFIQPVGVQADALPAVPEPIAEPIATPAEVPIPEPAVPATDPAIATPAEVPIPE
ncbi:MAG: hypothetical protein ACK53Y_21815, partial [bacterium]